MISVIATDSGNFNVFGTNDEGFCITGNLTAAELEELRKEIVAAQKEAKKR